MKKKYFSVMAVLALMCVASQHAFAQRDLTVVIPNSVDIDLTDQHVSVAALDYTNIDELTAFVKKYVPNVAGDTKFKAYRVNTDIKGYTHVDLQQILDEEDEDFVPYPVDGKELILHIDGNKNLAYITGDLQTKKTYFTQEMPAMSKIRKLAGNRQKIQHVIVQKDGKSILCAVIRQGHDKVYYSVETGDEVKRESMIRYAEPQKNKKTITSNTYYYPSSAMYVGDGVNYRDMNVAQRADGKYVLQDPERRIYTLEYNTPEIIKYNYSPEGESAEAPYELTLTEALKHGEDIVSDTEDFTAQHSTIASVIEQIEISEINKLYGDDAATYKIEIREFDTSDVTFNDIIPDWTKGTLLATAEKQYDPSSADGSIAFENLDQNPENNLALSFPSREEDPAGAIENKVRFIILFKNGEMLDMAQIPLSHTISMSEFTYKGDVESCIAIQRHTTQYKPALDVHWGLQRVQDVYKSSFNLDSFDGKGTAMLAMINAMNEDNACAAGTNTIDTTDDEKFGIMAFGMGKISQQIDNNLKFHVSGLYPCVDLETIGHEFTHLVASKLAYKNESGALNESYADIMGKMVEHKVLDSEAGYSVGDDVTKYVSWRMSQIAGVGTPQSIMRRFDDPNKDDIPCYYGGNSWLDYNTDQMDNGGVHINSGVQNHWFYLLCTGGDITPEQGEAVTITPLDRNEAELITFGSLMYCGIKNLDYKTARKNSVRIAEMYYGKESQQVKSVLEAWYAVGVGTDEWQPGMPTSINAINSVNTSKYDGARKMIDNGQIVIVKNGKQYNVAGQEM